MNPLLCLWIAYVRVVSLRLVSYFRDGWHQFDFAIVIISIAAEVIPEIVAGQGARQLGQVRCFITFQALKSSAQKHGLAVAKCESHPSASRIRIITAVSCTHGSRVG